ncbi:Hypothetical protein SMAX5B_009287 [Scophthalmus maximus]|uniref:Uncharacterized protein n=1 Tax=Scophthalmus maximus TaxID=52904 RepID=A0A2U9C5P7_SCOMX|nr:Hypothetical protein SMAX5B_009287 [Scophthalmus maximus]
MASAEHHLRNCRAVFLLDIVEILPPGVGHTLSVGEHKGAAMSPERSVFVTRGHCCADCCWPHGDYPPRGVGIVGPETQKFTFPYPPTAPQQGAEMHPC